MPLSRRQFLASTGLAWASSALGTPYSSGRHLLASGGDPNWDAVKDSFLLDRNLIHLGALLISAHPEPVRTAIATHRRELDRDPVSYLEGHNAPLRNRSRGAAAKYLGV